MWKEQNNPGPQKLNGTSRTVPPGSNKNALSPENIITKYDTIPKHIKHIALCYTME